MKKPCLIWKTNRASTMMKLAFELSDEKSEARRGYLYDEARNYFEKEWGYMQLYPGWKGRTYRDAIFYLMDIRDEHSEFKRLNACRKFYMAMMDMIGIFWAYQIEFK